MILIYSSRSHGSNWSRRDSDQGLAAFINELRPQSLKSFQTFTQHNFAPEVFQALNCHGESLIELKLNMCRSGAIPYVMLLRSCTNLVSLSLVARGLYSSRRRSRRRLKNSTDANPLEDVGTRKITSLLIQNSIRLTSLHCRGKGQWDNKEFHQALANLTSLQSLWLEGGALKHELENDVLVDSLTKLVNLTSLCLTDISESFVDRHIVQLAGSLPRLEILWTSGGILTNAIWGEVGALKLLQSLYLNALTSFTSNGILGFIEKLGPCNKGLVLSVTNVDVQNNALSCAEVELIQEMMDKKIKGRFEYELSTRTRRRSL